MYVKSIYMTKLLGYYTTAIEGASKPKNPRAAYINLSLVSDRWIKTTVMIGGKFVSIPRWLLLDHLSIEQTLDPARKSARDTKDRLTVQPELTKMLADKGFRYGEHMNASLQKPQLDETDVVRMKFADKMRERLQEKSITHGDVVKNIMVSFFKARPLHTSNKDAIAACMDAYGWNWFEFQAAWGIYRSKSNQWIAPNDPAKRQTSESIQSP